MAMEKRPEADTNKPELKRPEETINDLEPDEYEGEEVKGGATVGDFTFQKLSDKASPTLYP